MAGINKNIKDIVNKLNNYASAENFYFSYKKNNYTVLRDDAEVLVVNFKDKKLQKRLQIFNREYLVFQNINYDIYRKLNKIVISSIYELTYSGNINTSSFAYPRYDGILVPRLNEFLLDLSAKTRYKLVLNNYDTSFPSLKKLFRTMKLIATVLESFLSSKSYTKTIKIIAKSRRKLFKSVFYNKSHNEIVEYIHQHDKFHFVTYKFDLYFYISTYQTAFQITFKEDINYVIKSDKIDKSRKSSEVIESQAFYVTYIKNPLISLSYKLDNYYEDQEYVNESIFFKLEPKIEQQTFYVDFLQPLKMQFRIVIANRRRSCYNENYIKIYWSNHYVLKIKKLYHMYLYYLDGGSSYDIKAKNFLKNYFKFYAQYGKVKEITFDSFDYGIKKLKS